MCTASHNPKAYTGAKLVERGARGAVRRQRDRRGRGAWSQEGLGEAPGDAGTVQDVDVYAEFQARGAGVHRPGADPAVEGRARRRQRHGRADGRADPRAASTARARPHLLGARRRVPRPRAQPAAARRTARFIIEQGARRRAPTSGSPGTATPTAASSSTRPASSSTATSSPRCSPSRSCASARARDMLYDIRASRAVADTVERVRRPRARQPRRPRLLQAPHARRGRRRSAARSPATTTSPTSTTPTRARSRRC